MAEYTTERLNAPDLSKIQYRELASIVGEENLSSTLTDRIVYSRDLWPLAMIWLKHGQFPYLPSVIVWPRDTGQLQELVRFANREGVPLVPYAGGSGVCGATVPHHGGIVVDLKRFCRILEIDERAMTVTAEPCIVGEDLERVLNRYGYTTGHFPSSMYCSTLGGFLATRSAGQCSTKYGKIEDLVISLEVVLPTGEIVETKTVPRRATGPDLTQLIVGSEGTLGFITKATLNIFLQPETNWKRGYVFDDLHDGLEAIRLIMRKGLKPAVVRLYDETDTAIAMGNLGFDAKGCLLILIFEGVAPLVEAGSQIAHTICTAGGGEDLGAKPGAHWWETRYQISYRQAEIFESGGIVDTVEVAHTWSGIEALYAKMKTAMEAEDAMVLAHFSHAYPQGINIYFSVLTEGEPGEEPTVYYRLWDAAMRACIEAGGTISHHHGIGMQRARFMREEHGDGIDILTALKRALDPNTIMNPGKLGIEGGR